MAVTDVAPPRGGMLRATSSFFHRHPWAKLWLLLLPALLWLGVLYLGSLGVLLSYSFYRLEEFTGLLVREFGTTNYEQLLRPTEREIVLRTVAMAAAVTVACAFLAFPVSYYMARYASPRMRLLVYISVIMPLWSSYLVRGAVAWRSILAGEGVLPWLLDTLQLDGVLRFLLQAPLIGGQSLVQSKLSLFIVFSYLWLPFMILPVHAALERVPGTLLEASSDMGARPWMTFRKVILPLAKPGLVAGSIFTFSLTLGDFILPQIFGTSQLYLGQMVFTQIGVAGNLPLAAAFTFVAMAIMLLYLGAAKRLGAFEAL
ncbi:MAG TPA: ABC transporter permease [Actinomycetota bacterium]|nr:ABC transporter permease [Actinomycetota bacterium]